MSLTATYNSSKAQLSDQKYLGQKQQYHPTLEIEKKKYKYVLYLESSWNMLKRGTLVELMRNEVGIAWNKTIKSTL